MLSDDFVTVRKFEPSDVCQVMCLLQDVSKFLPEEDSWGGLADSFSGDKNCFACVVEMLGQIVGYGSVHFYTRLRGGASAVIEDVVVHKNYHRRGFGKKIIETLIQQSKTTGCLKVSLESNSSALGFYSKVGFTPGGSVMKNML